MINHPAHGLIPSSSVPGVWFDSFPMAMVALCSPFRWTSEEHDCDLNLNDQVSDEKSEQPRRWFVHARCRCLTTPSWSNCLETEIYRYRDDRIGHWSTPRKAHCCQPPNKSCYLLIIAGLKLLAQKIRSPTPRISTAVPYCCYRRGIVCLKTLYV